MPTYKKLAFHFLSGAMRQAILSFLFITTVLYSCAEHVKNTAQKEITHKDTAQATDTLRVQQSNEQSSEPPIVYDTLYNYRISLFTFDHFIYDENLNNTVFALTKNVSGKYTVVFSDSIYSSMRETRFDDYNEDGIKDILVQNYSDVRSNLSYYLYLLDTAKGEVRRIKGFEKIKMPEYDSIHHLISNYVMSGRDWTRFYKIQGDTIKDFGIIIYDDHVTDNYDRDYKKAIKKIQSMESR